MRLTDALFRFKKALPGGNIWRGKYRLYKKVTPLHMETVKRQYDLEEQNMFYLRHPYLTRDESYGHGVALGNGKKFVEKMRALRIDSWRDNITLNDRLGILKVTDKWE